MKEAQTHIAVTPEALAALGPPNLAYIKDVVVDGEVQYEIRAVDGRILGITPEREVAFAAARQHDFYPVSVH